MMLDPETRALVVREEILRSGAWKVPDPDEDELALCCEVCAEPLEDILVKLPWGGTVRRKPRPGTRVCPSCVRKNWRSKACQGCGGVTRTWDWPSKRRGHHTRGYCQTCREKIAEERSLTG